jgi:tetratricopeptide (TPR) repeat protein
MKRKTMSWPAPDGLQRRCAHGVYVFLAVAAAACVAPPPPDKNEGALGAYEDAEKARKEGKEERARLLFREALAARPDHVESHLGYQKLLQSQKKEADLVEEYRELLASRQDAWCYFLCGRLLHDPVREEALYRKGLEKDPASHWLLSALGDALTRQRRHEEAAKEHRAARDLRPDSLHLHADYMNALRDAGKERDLVAEYRERAAKAPEDVRAMFLHGLAAAVVQDLQAAEPLIRRAVEMAPEDGAVLSGLAWLELKKASHEAAQEILEKLERQDRHSESTLSMLGLFRCLVRHDRSGFAHLREAARLEPGKPSSFRYLAMAHLAFHEPDAAEEAAREALRLHSGDDAALYHMGAIAFARRQDEQAVQWLRKAIELHPTEAGYHTLLSSCHRRLGDLRAAQEALEVARTLGSRMDLVFKASPGAYEVRGRSRSRALELVELAGSRLADGDYGGAEGGFRAAIEVDPGCLEAHSGLARLLERTGMKAEALDRYRHLVDLCGEDGRHGDRKPFFSLRMAGCLYNLGTTDEAIALYREVWKEHGESLPRSSGLAEIVRAAASSPPDARRFRLEGLQIAEHAAENYCLPRALDAVLRHWKLPSDLAELGRALVEERRSEVGRSLEYIETLPGIASVSFTVHADLVKSLLERRFPVILTLELLHEGEYTGHASVIAGYDDRLGLYLLEDSNWFAGLDIIPYRSAEGARGLLVGPPGRIREVEAELPDREFWEVMAKVSRLATEEQGAAAREAVEEAVRLRPEAFRARLNLGLLLLEARDEGAAVAALEAAAALPGADARADAALGAAHLEAGNEAKAEAAFLRAAAAEPDFAAPRQGLSNLYGAKRKDYSKALPHLEKLAEIQPRNGMYHFFMAKALHELGRDDEALESCLFSAANGGPPESLSQAAYLHLNRRDYDSARPLLERYLKAAGSEEGKKWARETLERLEKGTAKE